MNKGKKNRNHETNNPGHTDSDLERHGRGSLVKPAGREERKPPVRWAQLPNRLEGTNAVTPLKLPKHPRPSPTRLGRPIAFQDSRTASHTSSPPISMERCRCAIIH